MSQSVFARIAIATACVLPLVACGGPGHDAGDGAAPDTATAPDVTDAGPADTAPIDTGPPDTGWTAGAHEPFPQIPNQGGRVLAHPGIVTLTFLNDLNAARYEAFANWVVGSTWLRTVGAEYGVSDGTVVGAEHWASNAPATASDATARAMLAAGLQDGSVPVPADGDLSNVIYVMYFPRSTQYTRDVGGGTVSRGCYDFLGYHSTHTLNGVAVPFAVVLDCGVSEATTEVGSVQVTAAHEIIEAATDPDLYDPTFSFATDETSAWSALGAEVADLCTGRLNYAVESGFDASRVWSNAAAARGDDPCMPVDATAGPYFNTSATPGAYQLVPAGATATYTLRGWSTGPVPDWPLRVRASGDFTPTTVLGAATLNNGGSTTLDVTVPATAARGSYARLELMSGDPTGVHHTWPLIVAVP